MDNQHKLIKGYRDLSQEDITAMNSIKEKGAQLEELIGELQNSVPGIRDFSLSTSSMAARCSLPVEVRRPWPRLGLPSAWRHPMHRPGATLGMRSHRAGCSRMPWTPIGGRWCYSLSVRRSTTISGVSCCR